MLRNLILPLLPSGNFPFTRASYLIGLWPFLPLDNVELYIVTFFQAFVAIKLNRTVVDKYIRPIIATNETIALCVVEPLHFAFVR